MTDPLSTPAAMQHAIGPLWRRTPLLLWLVWIVWLPFLLPPTLRLIQAHPDPLRLSGILAGMVLFVGLFLGATWQTARDLLAERVPLEAPHAHVAPVVSMGILSLILALLGHVGSNELLTPLLFVCAYVAGRFPLARAIRINSVIALLAGGIGWLLQDSWVDLGSGLFLIAVISLTIISLAQSLRLSRQLHIARNEIERLAVTSERLRIARDMHDLLGHTLSLIALKSELAGRLVAVQPARATAEISDVERVARATLQEVRDAVRTYRQPTLGSELDGADELLAAAGIICQRDGDIRLLADLSGAAEAMLAWAVREGVTNVIRHSQARHCTIRMICAPPLAGIEILNDGVRPDSGPPGSGLLGLRDRAATLGGQCTAGRWDGGFRLVVTVPLGPAARHTPDERARGTV